MCADGDESRKVGLLSRLPDYYSRALVIARRREELLRHGAGRCTRTKSSATARSALSIIVFFHFARYDLRICVRRTNDDLVANYRRIYRDPRPVALLVHVENQSIDLQA